MKKLRRNKAPSKTEFFLDKWIGRASHLSQVGLLAVTVFIYLYTVVPVYEKDKLDKEITKKELELQTAKRELKANYTQLRSDLVSSFIFHTGAKCSGLLEKPKPLIKMGEKAPTDMESYGHIFTEDISACLARSLDTNKHMKGLSKTDYAFLSKQLLDIGVFLEKEKKKAFEDFNEYPLKVASNPELLEPLNPDSGTAAFLSAFKGRISQEQVRKLTLRAQISQKLSRISYSYSGLIRSKVDSLSYIVWPTV